MSIPDSGLPSYAALRDRIDGALDALSEGRNTEFKESQPYEVLKVKLIKAALAMPNIRNGGLVIIGVSERNSEWSLDGIDPGHLSTYDIDTLLDQIHSYASPEAGVVLRSDGQVVTAYTSQDFEPHVITILQDAGVIP